MQGCRVRRSSGVYLASLALDECLFLLMQVSSQRYNMSMSLHLYVLWYNFIDEYRVLRSYTNVEVMEIKKMFKMWKRDNF